MKCNTCGYEFDKPNLKSCPLCGSRIIPGVTASERSAESVVRPMDSSPSPSPALTESETIDFDVSDQQEVIAGDTYTPASAPVLPVNPEPPAADPRPEPVKPTPAPVYTAPSAPQPQPTKPAPVTATARDLQARVEPEDPDQYVESGSYQPYPDDEGETEDSGYPYPQPGDNKSGSWMAIVIAAVAGLLIGALLYSAIG